MNIKILQKVAVNSNKFYCNMYWNGSNIFVKCKRKYQLVLEANREPFTVQNRQNI